MMKMTALRWPAAALLALSLAACSPSSGSSDPSEARAPASSSAPAPDPVLAGVTEGATDVPPTGLALRADLGTLTDVTLTAADGTTVPGTMTEGAWSPSSPLAYATSYRVTASAESASGTRVPLTSSFTTLTPAAILKADLTPYRPDSPVGVGMPVILRFNEDIPDQMRPEVISRLSVTPLTDQVVEGAWRWMSDDTLHYRTREYWPANIDVRVQVRLAGLDLGEGTWGGPDRDVTFRVGNSNLTTVDCDTHVMSTSVNGGEPRTAPISCGREDSDPDFVTRSGVHLITESYGPAQGGYTMDGATVGQDYETHVDYALRISNSGEFIHSAPWSVGSQGRRNVSHGCVNVSTSNAAWLHSISQMGDPVNVVGTDRPMELTNGLGDWTIPFEQWAN